MAKKHPETKKLYLNMLRRGEMRFDTVYSAPEAAKKAAQMARQGWKVDVVNPQSQHVNMTCTPAAAKRGKTVAFCKIKPAFKKAILYRR